jgi:hypothetical protein
MPPPRLWSAEVLDTQVTKEGRRILRRATQDAYALIRKEEGED